jgi:hypothetical protein
MTEYPTQQEIDKVAYFVEAVRELRCSLFFVEEHRNLSISMHNGDSKNNIKGNFPDTTIVGATIVPFRRVWQQNEPCYYMKIINILKKYVPEYRRCLDSILPDENRSIIKQIPCFRNISLSFEDVINVWFNTRYLHIGKSARTGKFNREDFERFNNQLGPVLFEFYFLSVIQEVGISFFNILQCAESFLRGLAQRGLVPSFPFQTDEASKNIERRTPGFTPKPDSPEQRVWRLRRRRQYAGINKFLDIINCSDLVAGKLISDCSSFDEFVRCFNVRLEHMTDINALNNDDIVLFDGCLDNEKMAIKNRKTRRGFIMKRRTGTLIWYEHYVPILKDQYAEFREAMITQHFK